MAKTTNQDVAAVVEKFARTIIPLPLERETTGSGNMIVWGDDNLYPNFLLRLYEEVPLHQSIINSKVDYLLGEGIVNKATGERLEVPISLSDNPESLANKVAYNWIIFGAFALGVQYNIFGKPIYVFFVPMNHVRTNKSRSKFWVCKDWYRESGNQLSYESYRPGANPGGKTRLYLYSAYTPSANLVYPSIRYSSGITSMVSETLINEFNKNNLDDGFSAAHIISFFKGMPDTEGGKLFTAKMKEAYSGTKGAKYIIDFNNPPTQQSPGSPIKVETVETPDYSAKLEGVNKKNETNILTAHQATSRILFGIEQSGGLGSGQELENAYQIFKEVWVKNNRNSVENGLNYIFKQLGFPEIEFRDKGSVLPKSLADTTKEKVYMVDELRAVDGLPPLPNGEGQKVIVTPAPIAPGQQPQTPPVAGAFSTERPKGKILTEEDFDKIKDIGIAVDGFDVLDEAEDVVSTPEGYRLVELKFDDAAEIEEYILKNDVAGMSVSELRAAIRKDLGIIVTTSELSEKLSRMTEAGIIGDQPTKKESIVRDVKVLYQYSVRPGYGAKLIPGSRGFCVKLIGNDRYYTREDIQQMSAIFGYDVFKHCGGWYYNPKTEEAENQCRHYWKSVRVLKKESNA